MDIVAMPEIQGDKAEVQWLVKISMLLQFMQIICLRCNYIVHSREHVQITMLLQAVQLAKQLR